MATVVQQKVEKFFEEHPRKTLNKNSLILHAGQNPESILYITEGVIRQYHINDKGDEVVINMFKKHSFIPITLAISGEDNKFYYDAHTEVVVREAPVDLVLNFVASNPDVSSNVLKRLSIGTTGVQQRIANLLGGDAKHRVLNELVIECRRFGSLNRDGSYDLSVNEGELAKRAGLARETVSRVLNSLNHNSLVIPSHTKIVVRNLDDLEKMLND